MADGSVPLHHCRGAGNPEPLWVREDDVLFLMFGGEWLICFTEDGIAFNHEVYMHQGPADFAAMFIKALERDHDVVHWANKIHVECQRKMENKKRQKAENAKRKTKKTV